MRTKLTYSVTKKEDWELDEGENKITGRYADIEVYGKTEKEAKENFNSFEEYLNNNSSYQVSTFPAIEEIKENVWGYFETIDVNDHDDFEELKEIYKEWKASLKVEKVESSNSEPVVVAEQSQTTREKSIAVENTDVNTISENPVQVTETKETCNDVQKTANTPSYRIYQSTINLKGTQLQVGQKYRLDLLNGTNVHEVTELNNLAWSEFTTGHKDGNNTIMYIEITGQKSILTNSQLCNSNDKKLQGEFILKGENFRIKLSFLNFGYWITNKLNTITINKLANLIKLEKEKKLKLIINNKEFSYNGIIDNTNIIILSKNLNLENLLNDKYIKKEDLKSLLVYQ